MSNPGTASSSVANFQGVIGLPLTEAQFANPTTQILANTSAVYQRLDGSLWQSNGQILSQLFGASNSVAANNALSGFSAALARTRANTGDTKIAFIGDSTTAGLFGTGSNWTNCRQYNRANQIAGLLKNAGLNSNASNVYGDTATGPSNFLLYDPRVTFGSGWTTSAVVTAGGGSINHNTNGAFTSANFAFADQTNIVDVWYIQNTGYGQFSIGIDGVVNGAQVNCNGSLTIQKATRTFSTSTHIINLNKSGDGQVIILAVEAYRSDLKSVRCWGMGVGGWKASDWAATANIWDPLSMLQTYAPDLTVINLGINEWLTAVAPATFIANLTTIITGAQISGDVVLEIPVPTSTAQTAQATQDGITAAERQLVINKGLVMSDIYSSFRTYAAGQAIGLYLPANDLIHPGATGYQRIASLLYGVLFQNGIRP